MYRQVSGYIDHLDLNISPPPSRVNGSHVNQITPHNNPFNIHKPGQSNKNLDSFSYSFNILVLILKSLLNLMINKMSAIAAFTCRAKKSIKVWLYTATQKMVETELHRQIHTHINTLFSAQLADNYMQEKSAWQKKKKEKLLVIQFVFTRGIN